VSNGRQQLQYGITNEDAASYNISTILKKRVMYLRCKQCQATALFDAPTLVRIPLEQ